MKNIQKLLPSLIIGLSVIITAIILAGSWSKSHQRNETISVTGSAKKDFTSDLIVWRGNFSQKSVSIKEAYSGLKKDADIIRNYLISKGIKKDEIIFPAININKDYKTSYNNFGSAVQEFNGYVLSQDFRIESKDVDKIEAIAREVTELIDQGIELYSYPPEYYYTQLAGLKIEMLSEATADGRQRAEKIASNAGRNLGHLRKATMGIFQITAQNSTEDFTYGGAFNISSKRKSVSITMKLEFGIR
jgi:hypothetical protein